MIAKSWILSFAAAARAAAMAALCLAGLGLAGCASTAPPYQATNDNARTLQAIPGGTVAVGKFTAKSDSLNHLGIRASTFESPNGSSFAEYLQAALKTELQAGGKLDDKSPTVVTGELLENTIDSGVVGMASARISARIVAMRGGAVMFDKVVDAESQWKSSFFGAVAIPLAREHYIDTMKTLIGKLLADPDFRRVF